MRFYLMVLLGLLCVVLTSCPAPEEDSAGDSSENPEGRKPDFTQEASDNPGEAVEGEVVDGEADEAAVKGCECGSEECEECVKNPAAEGCDGNCEDCTDCPKNDVVEEEVDETEEEILDEEAEEVHDPADGGDHEGHDH